MLDVIWNNKKGQKSNNLPHVWKYVCIFFNFKHFMLTFNFYKKCRFVHLLNINSIREPKLLQNPLLPSQISVYRRFPTSFSEDLMDQYLTREGVLRFYVFVNPVFLISIFICSIINFVGSTNSWNQTRLICTLCPAGILWTPMNNDVSFRDHFVTSTTHEPSVLCFIFLCLWALRNRKFLTFF